MYHNSTTIYLPRKEVWQNEFTRAIEKFIYGLISKGLSTINLDLPGSYQEQCVLDNSK